MLKAAHIGAALKIIEENAPRDSLLSPNGPSQMHYLEVGKAVPRSAVTVTMCEPQSAADPNRVSD